MRQGPLHMLIALMSITAGCAGSSSPAAGQVPATPAASSARPGQPGAAARQTCAVPDDSTGATISGTFKARPDVLYAAGAAALRELGYAVLETMPPKELITAPSHAWPAGTATDPWHGKDHPGVELFLSTRAAADSATVTIGARALCRVSGASGGASDSEVGRYLEGIVTLTAMNALINRLRGTSPQ